MFHNPEGYWWVVIDAISRLGTAQTRNEAVMSYPSPLPSFPPASSPHLSSPPLPFSSSPLPSPSPSPLLQKKRFSKTLTLTEP